MGTYRFSFAVPLASCGNLLQWLERLVELVRVCFGFNYCSHCCMCESPSARDGGPVVWFLSSAWKINRNEDLANSGTVNHGRDLRRASGLKSIIPPKNPSWCMKYKCWAKRSRCCPLPWFSLSTAWSWGQELMFAEGVEPDGSSACHHQVWAGFWAAGTGLGRSSPSKDVGVTVVQGGIISREPGQELRSDGSSPGEHQAK